jgi:hypothetical protein
MLATVVGETRSGGQHPDSAAVLIELAQYGSSTRNFFASRRANFPTLLAKTRVLSWEGLAVVLRQDHP